jgi:hypothetical protein
MEDEMNSRQKGKVGEREFAALLRQHGFDARRGVQFAGGADSPDVVSPALSWLHIEVKRTQALNLAKACAQAARDGAGKTWIVAHRRNRGPWFITMDSDACYQLLRRVVLFFDFWPFMGPRPITMDAEVFFQFLRATLPREDTSLSATLPSPVPSPPGSGVSSTDQPDFGRACACPRKTENAKPNTDTKHED